MNLEADRKQLLHEMKTTKGCRFNAAERLKRRDKRIIQVTAFASVYVIILTVLPLFFHVNLGVVNFLNAITLCFSLIILAASLLQYSNNDPVRAEQHHRCALEVNALRRELRATEPITSAQLFDFGKRYDEILQKYSVNHSPVDYEKYKIEHPNEFMVIGESSEKTDETKTVAIENTSRRVLIGMTWALMASVASVLAEVVFESGSFFKFIEKILF